MHSDNMATARPARPRAVRTFTVESANRALVLVRRVVQDVVTHYNALTPLRERFETLRQSGAPDDKLLELRDQIAAQSELLNGLASELREIGCELKDWALGLIDFPAVHEGRKVWLCWRLGEETITHWHELEEGFSGRRPIQGGFG